MAIPADVQKKQELAKQAERERQAFEQRKKIQEQNALKLKLQNLQSNRERLKRDRSQLEQELQNNTLSIESTKRRLVIEKSSQDRKKSAVSVLKAKLAQLQSFLRGVDTKISDGEYRKSHDVLDGDTEKRKIAQIHMDLEKKQKEIDLLEAELRRAREDLNKLNFSLKQEEDAEHDIGKSKDELERDIEHEKAEKIRIEREISDINQEINNAERPNGEDQNLATQESRYEGQSLEVKRKIGDMHRKLDDLDRQIDAVTQDLRRLN